MATIQRIGCRLGGRTGAGGKVGGKIGGKISGRVAVESGQLARANARRWGVEVEPGLWLSRKTGKIPLDQRPHR